MIGASCILCGAPAPETLQMCVACASVEHGDTFVFVRTIAPRDDFNTTLDAAGLGTITQSNFAAQARAGRRPLLRTSSSAAHAIAAALGDYDVTADAVAATNLRSRIPSSFVVMLIAIIIVGGFAGMRAAPMFLLLTPILAIALVVGANAQLGTPAITPQASMASMPPNARRALRDALSQIRATPERTLLLDIAKVGETAMDALGPAFRNADVGRSVSDLVEVSAGVAIEAARYREISDTTTTDATQARTIADARDVRLQQLQRASELLSSIAHQSLDAPESAAHRITELLSEVRKDSSFAHDAVAEVQSLTS